MKRFEVRDHMTDAPLGEAFGEDALDALSGYANDHGLTRYDRDSYDADDFITTDTPDRAVVVFENTELVATLAPGGGS